MRSWWKAEALALLLAGLAASMTPAREVRAAAGLDAPDQAPAAVRSIEAWKVPAARSGLEYASPDVRAQQRDELANPGMLWVERGARLWQQPAGPRARACADCHGDAAQSMRGVAARGPVVDAASGRLMNLEARVNACRTERQAQPAWRYESEELLSMTAFVAHQSLGMPLDPDIEGAAKPHFEAGRALFYRRLGQMNLACAHCHERNAGRRLLGDPISEGMGNGYPIYRLEWQTAGSLHRRLRACLFGVRAEMLPGGAPEYVDLELFLAWRARGLPVETPAVRR